MRVAVDAIPDQGLTVAVELEQSWARGAAVTALEAPPIALSGQLIVARRPGFVEVTGELASRVARVCERCGEPVELDLHATDFALAYAPEGPERATGEIRLGASDLDMGWYRGGELDLADVVSEILALELPTLVACADVPACDARVAALVGADAAPAASPFAALRDLF